MILEVIEYFRITIKDQEIQFNTSLQAENHHINADKAHLSNMLYNLFDNSIKYSAVNPEITISTKNNNKLLQIEIKDNGIGIEPKFISRIFNKFYRIPTGNVHNVKGFGLGLNYVKNITEAHYWKIHVESKLHEGTSFTIKMPFV